MNKLNQERHFQRMQGEFLFGETLGNIKDYIHQCVLTKRYIPGLHEVLGEVDYIGMPLHKFLEGTHKVSPETVDRYIFRLRELLRIAEFEYERSLIA